jgi:hypothetical protein
MSAVRRSGIALALLGLFLISACGQPTANDTSIGVRPGLPGTGPIAITFDPASLNSLLTGQLDAVKSLDSIAGDNYLAVGLLALDSTLTLRQTERLIALQSLGQSVIDQRLKAIGDLRAQVAGDPSMSWSQKGRPIQILDSAAAALQSMRLTILGDQLVDKTHADIVKVATVRVYGLVLPQVHMLVAAYQMARLAAIFSNEVITLRDQIVVAASTGRSVAVAVAAVNDLTAQIGTMNRASYLAIVTLPNLTAAAYPGNKGTLLMVRRNLTSGKYAGSQGSADASRARASLGL